VVECGVCVLRLYETIWCLEDRVLPTPDLHTYQLYNPVFLGIWGITDPHGLQHHDIKCAQIAHWVQTLGVVIRLCTVNYRMANYRMPTNIVCMGLFGVCG
jgi:hypothetical protein